MLLTEEASRMSRGHIRFFASVERAGPWFKVFMSVFPILVNFAWVAIYFVERDNDVFRTGGACSYLNRSELFDGPSPFFITTRSVLLWQTQTLFAMLNAFLWAPFRYMRTGLTTGNFVFLMVIELLTVFPFLFSLVFFPAYVAYVPTYLRGFIMKHEILFVMSKEGVKDRGNRLFLTWSLMLDLFSTMITVIGILEWAQNNFPRQNYDALWGEPDLPVYGCYSFFVCIYWFIVTISTAGYGDIVPLNNVARLVIVCSIAFFLLFLPEFINRVTTIMRLSANLKEVKFAQQKKRNFVIVDGAFPLPIAQQALALFQPKFNLNEFAIKNLVLILAQDDEESGGGEEEEFTRLTTDQAGLFCELFLMQGRVLQSDEGLLRSQARAAKTIYILPRYGVKAYARTTQALQTKRESMAESREFCLRRDFDQIKRIGGLRNRLDHEQVARTRTLLFHESNKKLVETSSSSSSLTCCDPMNVLCLDSFGQRIAASTVLVPAFNTLWALLMLSGSVTDKTFSEYDAEADGERFTHEHYLAPVARQNSPSVVDEEEDICFERNDDIEYVLGLHHTLLLAEFTGRSGTKLRQICLHALQQRILVLGCVRRESVCGVHFDFNAHGPTVQWDHTSAVRTRDYLVCFGDAQEISQLNDPSSLFWADMDDETVEREEVLLHAVTTTAPETVPRRHTPREGDFSVLRQQPHYLKDQHLADARARSEIDEINLVEDGGVYLPVEPTDKLPTRLENHVIVYTASHVSFVYFVKKLRSSGVLHNEMPILLMDPKPPSLFHWSEVGAYPNVFFLQGSPFILDDLLRAGFEHANSLVLLVDYRARYQTTNNNNLDEENLLGERVACKLKQILQCKTRIITHLVKEEHFEYIEGNQTKLAGLEQQPRLKSFATLFQSVWSPIQSQSYIAGECFFPSIFQPLFFVSETRGNWLQAFLNELCEAAGRAEQGLVLRQVEVAEEGETYAQLAVNMLLREAGGGLAIGLFRNYDAPANASFRGVLLFPSNELVVTNHDRVYVLGGSG